jgi:FtsH-binding integral membrane protein
MNAFMDNVTMFYDIDSSTYLMIAFFCGWAAYVVRSHVANAAFLMFLYPLFCIAGFTAYALAIHLQLFSPKRQAEWVMYTIFAASVGATVGIGLVAILRRLQDKFTTFAHIRRTLKRQDHESEQGYEKPQV